MCKTYGQQAAGDPFLGPWFLVCGASTDESCSALCYIKRLHSQFGSFSHRYASPCLLTCASAARDGRARPPAASPPCWQHTAGEIDQTGRHGVSALCTML